MEEFQDTSQFPVESDLYYFDPGDINEKNLYGHAFHLTLDYDALGDPTKEHTFIHENHVDMMLSDLAPDEIFGHHWEFDSLSFAMTASQALAKQMTDLNGG